MPVLDRLDPEVETAARAAWMAAGWKTVEGRSSRRARVVSTVLRLSARGLPKVTEETSRTPSR